MKLRVIGLMAFLFAGNVAAEEVQLVCVGTDTVQGQDGSYTEVELTRQVRINEEAGTMSFTDYGGDYDKARDVEFSDQYVTGKLKGDWRRWGQTAELELDRYSGVLKVKGKLFGRNTLQCKRVAQEKLF